MKSLNYYHSAATWMEGKAEEQLKQTAALPGMREVVGMPDLHPGLSTPIGAAFGSEGVIYPELVGADAGCGMMLLRTSIPAAKFSANRVERRLLEQDPEPAGHEVPAGWPDCLRRDLGTVGHGNHFIELQELIELEAPEPGIDRKRLFLLVHTGSRGHGRALKERTPSGGLDPAAEAGRTYLERHDRLVEWAALNRRLAGEGFLRFLGESGELFSDNCHNSVTPDPERPGRWIHRKGASCTEGGAPFVIAGSRGTLSYLVEPVGPQRENLWSAAHGAGRKWTRHSARARLEQRFSPENLRRTKLGGLVVCNAKELLYEEAPEAYKNIDTVIGDLTKAGIIRVIGILKPLLTYKTPSEERKRR